MVREQLTVKGDVLRSGKARNFVDITSKFNSSVYLEVGNKRVNAKSIIGVLSMNLEDGDKVTLLVDGNDETAAFKAVWEYMC